MLMAMERLVSAEECLLSIQKKKNSFNSKQFIASYSTNINITTLDNTNNSNKKQNLDWTTFSVQPL